MDPLKCEILCRICLSEDIKQIDFYNIHTKMSDMSIAEMFSAVSGLSVEPCDPQFICQLCWKNLWTTNKFLELSQMTEQKLRKRMNLVILGSRTIERKPPRILNFELNKTWVSLESLMEVPSCDFSEDEYMQLTNNTLEILYHDAENKSVQDDSKVAPISSPIKSDEIPKVQDTVLNLPNKGKGKKKGNRIFKQRTQLMMDSSGGKTLVNMKSRKRRKFSCYPCNTVFGSLGEKHKHMYETHRKMNAKMCLSKCHICGFRFKGSTKYLIMYSHYRKMHPGINPSLGIPSNEKSENTENSERIEASKEFDKSSSKSFEDASSIVEPQIKETSSKCHVCGLRFKRKRYRGRYMAAHYRKQHPGVEPFVEPSAAETKAQEDVYREPSEKMDDDSSLVEQKITISFFPEEQEAKDGNKHIEESELSHKDNDSTMEEPEKHTEIFPPNFSCSFCWEEYKGQCQCPPEKFIETLDIVDKTLKRSKRGKSKPLEPRSWLCDHCGLKYTTESAFRGHSSYYIKNKNTREICEICGVAYKGNVLKKHILRHTKQQQFECAKCGRSFHVKSSLAAHMDTHNTYLKYKCSICKKRLKTLKTLSWHKRTHTMERNYECPVEGCLAAFVVNATLRSHIEKHHPEHPLPPKGTIVSKHKAAKNQINIRLTLNNDNPAFALVKYRGLDAEYRN